MPVDDGDGVVCVCGGAGGGEVFLYCLISQLLFICLYTFLEQINSLYLISSKHFQSLKLNLNSIIEFIAHSNLCISICFVDSSQVHFHYICLFINYFRYSKFMVCVENTQTLRSPSIVEEHTMVYRC